jgi:hypothetical protein
MTKSKIQNLYDSLTEAEKKELHHIVFVENGKKAGSKKSEIKAATSAKNGILGGRPKSLHRQSK